MSFKIGNIVQLKSGGPTMKVCKIVGEDPILNIHLTRGYKKGDLAVEYFDDNNTLEKSVIKASSVKVIEEKGLEA